MRVLVTGATGFIGGNLARQLWQRGFDVKALVRPGSNTLTIDDTDIRQVHGDILDADSVARAMKGCQAVFHCAAVYSFWSKRPDLVHKTNVEGTSIVLQAARQAGVDKVVHTSTVSTIGLTREGLGVPANEDTPMDPGCLVGHYKKSKYQAERLALEMAKEGLPVVVVNPTAPVGPWDVKPTPTGGIILDFMRGRIPGYLDTGMNLVDVEDVAAGHISAMEVGEPGQRYILGNRNIHFKDMLRMLQDVTGRPAPKWRLPYWLALGAGYLDQIVEGSLIGRQPRIPLEGLKVAKHPMYVSPDKAVRQLRQPQQPIEAALEKAVRWFTDHNYVKVGPAAQK